MSNVRVSSVRDAAPSTEVLEYIGMERYQIAAVQRMSANLQWMAHDLYLAAVMRGDDPDTLEF
jgi:hypothetical protein